MAVKNPFIRYKIYSTSGYPFDGSDILNENVKVACLISTGELEKEPFLQKILSAAKIAENDYQIIPIPEKGFISAAVHKGFDQLEYILCFGIPASAADIHIPHQVYRSADIRGTKVVQLPGLQKIESDNNEKQKLWQLLKKEFIQDD